MTYCFLSVAVRFILYLMVTLILFTNDCNDIDMWSKVDTGTTISRCLDVM